jgi:hypothetical protein
MMMLKIIILFTLISSAVLFLPSTTLSAEILDPEVTVRDNKIMVNTGLTKIKEIEDTINSGIEKEIVFTIELFRAWKFWPDQFVVSKKIHKTIKYDDLRGQYFVSSNDGTIRIESKFKHFNLRMRDWFFTVNQIDLANIKELDPGNYYVRVVAESKSREIPSVIGLLMFFIPEVEMSLAKESHVLHDIGYSE